LARFKDFFLDPRAAELRKGTQRTRLQDKPFQMLRLLLEQSGEVVSREELQKTLWPGGTVVDFDHGIATALKKLRQALRDDAHHPRYIETLARRGYRWIAGVEWIESGEKPETSKPADETIDSIAVLPFANLGGDPEEDYFCDGLAEEILNALTRIPGLRVTARTSSFSFRGKQHDIRQVGQALNVRSILEGGVRRSGNRIRITVQLIDVATGYHLWSDTIEPEAHDAWAVQEQIAGAIVAAIQLELRPEERRTSADTHRPHLEAFELYLKARYASEYMQEASQRKAVEMFQSAIASDPFYSLPLVGLARCYLNLTALNLVPPSEVVPHARAALGRALALDPNLPEAHGLMANTIARHEWNWPRAEQHFLRALELAPQSAVVHHEFSIACLVPQGRFEQGLAENRRARELEPLRPSFVRSYIWLLIHARQFGEAERECRRLIAEGRDPAYFRNRNARDA
jgi:TolB-like protein/Tfp pilus assembly protein PilF